MCPFKITETGYTEGELKLIRQFIPLSFLSCGTPMTTYKMCVEKAFIENMSGPHVEALRRAYRALILCEAYRHTSEFEALVQF